MFERVKKLICSQLNISEDKIKPETRILEDLQADSLDMIELVTEIESEFNVSISDDDMTKLKTIQDVVNFCESLSK